MPREDVVVQKALADLQDEFGPELLGLLATGSRIHGQPGPTSDLDLHVVIAVPRRRRRNRVVEGIEVEMFLNPPFCTGVWAAVRARGRPAAARSACAGSDRRPDADGVGDQVG